ncbi:MAG: GFA family protein [Myxococcota bacterium]
MLGSCLCGGVAFEAEALSGAIGHCHCRTCRKAHSAAFATTARVRRAQFRWTRGEELLGHFESTPGKWRRFCSRCGTQLIADWADQDEVILRLGALDSDPGARPAGHIWASHDVPWLRYGAELPGFSEGLGSAPVVLDPKEG